MNTVQKDKDGCILEVDLEYPKIARFTQWLFFVF